MNAPIAKLFGVFVVMFALLIAWTSRWTVFESKALNNNPLNKRTLADEIRIKRGLIYADDGKTVLAKSVPAGGGTWKRSYPTGPLFSQVIGYADVLNSASAGLEQSRGSELRGIQQGLTSIFGQLSGTRHGDDLYTTLDPKAQAVAARDLAPYGGGSVVAITPGTGAIKVMYSKPTYNDNQSTTVCIKTPGCSLFNEATQGADPPGSTFKVVTAVAAIDSGKYTPTSTISGKSPITVSGVPLANDNNDQYGLITLSDALTFSVNTVFAQVAQAVGRPTMTEYMKRFGFYSKPPLDYPPGQLNPSRPYGVTASGKSYAFRPGSPNEDIGRIGIGQGGLDVTPLQMAMVVAAIANNGVLMTPHFMIKAVDSTGQTVATDNPSAYSTVMKPSTARAVQQMMLKVVEEGTGTPAQLGNISVAGKTGTAQKGFPGSGITEPWFIGFAPVNNPKVAVAVTVDKTLGGYGATVAAPIARDIIQTLLSEGQ
jgi:peptidoglycan glycosyltransferase